MCSTNANHEALLAAFREGADEYLVKPVTVQARSNVARRAFCAPRLGVSHQSFASYHRLPGYRGRMAASA